jgi:hypothetical protein
MRGETVEQPCGALLVAEVPRAADETVRIRRVRDQQRIARPLFEMSVEMVDGRVGLAREREIEEADVPRFARRHAGRGFLRGRQRLPRLRDFAFPHEQLGLAGMGKSEPGIGLNRTVERLDRTRIQREREIVTLHVRVARGG